MIRKDGPKFNRNKQQPKYLSNIKRDLNMELPDLHIRVKT